VSLIVSVRGGASVSGNATWVRSVASGPQANLSHALLIRTDCVALDTIVTDTQTGRFFLWSADCVV
jgi:hypothetical protein